MRQIDSGESGFGDEKLWPSGELTRDDAVRADLISRWWAAQTQITLESARPGDLEALQEEAERWVDAECARILGENLKRDREEIHRLAIETFERDEIAPTDTVTLRGVDGEMTTLPMEEAVKALGLDGERAKRRRRGRRSSNGKIREANA